MPPDSLPNGSLFRLALAGERLSLRAIAHKVRSKSVDFPRLMSLPVRKFHKNVIQSLTESLGVSRGLFTGRGGAAEALN